MPTKELGKVYVTGADGFIGSHLVEKLVAENYDVTALCLYNSFGNFGWLNEISEKKPKNLKIILGDIRDPFFMKESIKGHDTVFHLAALIAIPHSYKAPKSYVETNINGTLNILEACLSAQVKRFIHTSTSEVYGSAQFVPITEQHPLQAQSPYSATKIAADMLVESYFKSFDLPSIILRPFNTYGPRQSMRAIIPTIVAQVLSGNKEIKVGNLSPIRDFNFVTDTVNAFLAVSLATDSKVLGKTFNTGTGSEASIHELFSLISKITDTDYKIISDHERIRPEKSEVEKLISDPSKLKDATGWCPKYSLLEGITEFIEWIRFQKRYLKLSDIYHT